MVNAEPAIGCKWKPEAIAVKLARRTTGQEQELKLPSGPGPWWGRGAAWPWSVDGEAQGAVHLLADEARRAALRRGARGHPVREQRALLGRRLGQLRLLQLPATQGHGSAQRHTANHMQQVNIHNSGSVLGHTENVLIHIPLFTTRGQRWHAHYLCRCSFFWKAKEGNEKFTQLRFWNLACCKQFSTSITRTQEGAFTS